MYIYILCVVPFITENAAFACDQARELSCTVAKLPNNKRSHDETKQVDDDDKNEDHGDNDDDNLLSSTTSASKKIANANLFSSGKSFKDEFEEKRKQTKNLISLKDIKVN